MKITTTQLRQIIREEIKKISLNEAATPKKLNKGKLQKILELGTRTKSEYNYNILNKGWATTYMGYITRVEEILKGGEAKFNPELAIKLSDRFESINGGWESAASAGKEWSKIEDATTALAGALYEGDWDDLVKYWNNTLCPAVDSFKL
jgi:hypothetical protein